MYFDNRLWDLIVTHTNENTARKVNRENRKENLEPVSLDEMKAFIALSMYMRLVRLPRISDYYIKTVLISNSSFWKNYD